MRLKSDMASLHGVRLAVQWMMILLMYLMNRSWEATSPDAACSSVHKGTNFLARSKIGGRSEEGRGWAVFNIFATLECMT